MIVNKKIFVEKNVFFEKENLMNSIFHETE